MKTKKLLLIGAIALVIVSCVLAAGCTSTETTVTDDASTDDLVGVWFSDSQHNRVATVCVLADGTGYAINNNVDGTSGINMLSWKKNADGTYAMKWSNGSETTWTLNSAKDIMTTSSGNTFVKKSLDEDAKNILGVWTNSQTNYVTTFNADGTGTNYKDEGNDISKFTWSVPETGKIKISYLSGISMINGETLSGKVTEWTYDSDKDALSTTDHESLVRPTESVAGFTLTTFTTEPIVGQWTKKYQKDGKTVDAVLTLRNDGTGNWMALGDVEGMQITSYYKNTWKKIGENTYQVTTNGSAYDGNSYEFVYDSATDALTANGKVVYTRLDPIVGIWSSILTEKNSNTASHLFKPDGTGVATVAYDDGSSKVFKMTWKKNSDGTYAITYPDGEKVTYSIDAAGNTITTGSGATKSKVLYRDMTSLMSIIGAWYNNDKDLSFVFNADNTGFRLGDGYVLPFTWKMKGVGKYELTYPEGAWESKDKVVTEWTYDGDNNVFISSQGTKFIRPSESVKDKITLYS